jgi:hypothetical protein
MFKKDIFEIWEEERVLETANLVKTQNLCDLIFLLDWNISLPKHASRINELNQFKKEFCYLLSETAKNELGEESETEVKKDQIIVKNGDLVFSFTKNPKTNHSIMNQLEVAHG